MSESEPRVVHLGDHANVAGLVDEWSALTRRLPDTSYFQTPAWVLTWWDTIADRAPTRIARWYDGDGHLVALVGLSRARQRLHYRLPISVGIYANAGSGPGDADHCGPLVTPALWPAVSSWLKETIGSRSLLVRNAEPPLAIADGRIIDTTTTPQLNLLSIDGSVGRSPNVRRQLRRYARRLRAKGVTFDWLAPGSVQAPVVDALFRLHEQRRALRSGGSSLTERHRELVIRLCGESEPGCGAAAVVARHDDTIVGVCLGFQWKDCFSAYQSGWDPAFASYSLGTVLIYEAILAAIDAGLDTFDFLRGAEGYKYRFGARDALDVTLEVPRGLTGHVLGARSQARALLYGQPRFPRPPSADVALLSGGSQEDGRTCV